MRISAEFRPAALRLCVGNTFAMMEMALVLAIAAPSVPHLIHYFRGAGTPERLSCLATLEAIGPAARVALPTLLRVFPYADESVQAAILRMLPALSDDTIDLIAILVRSLQSSKIEVRRAAIQALGKLGPSAKGALPALRPFLDDKRIDMRIDAAFAMAAIRKQAQPFVSELHGIFGNRSNSGELRAHAAAALLELGPLAVEALPAIRQALREPNIEYLHETILGSLDQMGPFVRSVEPELIGLLESEDYWVRHEAIRLLGAFGGEAAIVPLAVLIEHATYEDVAKEARLAQARICVEGKYRK
ncbi:MAG: HEAT repeat domain-containing protein [Gemmataceae bacterium]|nr:HEAT repeat domain-containing protein [Gemmataceae bacterium]